MGSFDDLALAVASFGGNNRVILDDLGKPSIMVGIPKMKYSDIITGGAQETLPWWVVEGVEKEIIWVSKYLNCVVNDRAYSLPMKDPKVNVNFDDALQFSRNKGEGWHLLQNGVFAALSLWSEKNGTIPRGNTKRDVSHEKNWERGVNTFMNGSEGGRTATGSGPVTWNHDHSAAGIADLCGNCWEWVSGTRLVNGEIQIIPYGNAMKSDCSMGYDSTEWKAIMPDGRLVEPGTAGTLKIDRTSINDTTLRINTVITRQTSDTNFTEVSFKNTAAVSGVSIPKILIAAGFFPDNGTQAPGHFYARNNGERMSARGSYFGETSYGGVASLDLRNNRSFSLFQTSFRSAYYE